MKILPDFLIDSAPGQRGIKSFRDWRFYLVVVLLSGSLLCLIYDPNFIAYGEFVFRQGVIVMLMALTIAGAFLWETPIFGKPAGANLLLQALCVPPFVLLVTRLCAVDGKSSQELVTPNFSGFFNFFQSAFDRLMDNLPWIKEFFSNWQITLLFLLVLIILCLKNIYYRVGAIALLLIVLLGSQFNRDAPILNLIFGLVLMAAALSFMFSRYDEVAFFENVLKRIRRSQTVSPEEFRAILCVMEQLARKKRLSDANFRQIVKDSFAGGIPYSNQELNLISGELAKRMINSYDLVTLSNDSEGIFLSPDPTLFYYDSLLRAVATVPRIVFVGLLALLWVIMPFDLIPDALPLVGTLDDIAVMFLSGVVIQSSTTSMVTKHHE